MYVLRMSFKIYFSLKNKKRLKLFFSSFTLTFIHCSYDADRVFVTTAESHFYEALGRQFQKYTKIKKTFFQKLIPFLRQGGDF